MVVVEQNCRQQLLPNLHPMIKVCVTNFSLNNLKIVGLYFILKKRKMNSTFPCLSRINSWGKTEPRCRSRLTPIWCRRRRSFNILSHLKLEHCCEIIRLKNFVCIHESWCDVSRILHWRKLYKFCLFFSTFKWKYFFP